MAKTPKYDAKVKEVLDKVVPCEMTCEFTGKKWNMTEEEIGWYKYHNVVPPNILPDFRLLQVSCYYGCYQWWWNKHFDTGEPVLTYVHPASGIKVLPDKEWFQRDFSSTNHEFTTEKPVFDIFGELLYQIPLNATRNLKEPENSIAHVSMGDVDSTFTAGCSKSRKNFYCLDCDDVEACLDCNSGLGITDCYQVNHSSRLHRCKFAYECYDSIDSTFIFDCRNCEKCFGSFNKRHKKYLWYNEQLSEEEWDKKMSEVDLGDVKQYEELKQKFYDLVENEAVWPENFNDKTSESTGEYLVGCTKCYHTSFSRDAHNNYYCYGIWKGSGNAFTAAVPGENNYFNSVIGYCSKCKFSATLVRCDNCEYCFNCYDCEHCFGCIGLNKKRFHIFNQEYSEDEYWTKLDDLKCAMMDRGEYGHFIPGKFSTSYFPEGGGVFYLGAEMDDWDKVGMKHFEIEDEGAFGESRVEKADMKSPEDLPAHIKDLNADEWIGVPIFDAEIKRPYTLLKQEIDFYKKHNLPAPREHFTNRIKKLQWCTNIGLIEEGKCHGCEKDVWFAPNRTFPKKKVHCMDCYLKHIEQYG